ncbi:hypothetical protein BS47DRAFT_1252318, partial [Hydnum rufescens UP504]
QEKAVLDWITHLGLLAQPMECHTIGPCVKDICGTFPGKNWLACFLECNKDAVRYCQTAALDPKCAHSFNYTTVHNYFDKLKTILEEHTIPWENVYNMDEKGCQL